MVGPGRYRALTHRSSPHPTAGAVAGLVAGLLLAGGLAARDVASNDHDARTSEAVAVRPADRDAFLAAWQRSRSGTWVVRLAFTRRSAAGGRLDDELRIAQRPPDRLVVGPLGAVAGRLAGRSVNCGVGASGVLRCGSGQAVGSYADEVRRDVSALRSYFVGDRPLYSLRRDRGCFVLKLGYRYPSPPYGDRARFCFDAATGAPTRSEVHRREGTDIQLAVEIRTDVVPSDLVPPAG
jgi:hypothetical protein